MRVLAAAVSLGLFVFIIWYSYQQGHQDGAESTPPLIKADVNPTRVRPDKPGGMKVPDQDKLVYNRVDPSTQDPNVERLLPPPEEPLAPSFPKTGQFTDIPVPVIPQQLPPQLESNEAPPPVRSARQPRRLVPPPAAPAQRATPSPAPRRTAAAAPRHGGFRVQLGAFRGKDAASKAWIRLQRRHKDLLAGMSATFQRADLGSKGVFFRLRAGPVTSEIAARNICSELAKRKAGCLVVRP